MTLNDLTAHCGAAPTVETTWLVTEEHEAAQRTILKLGNLHIHSFQLFDYYAIKNAPLRCIVTYAGRQCTLSASKGCSVT